MTRSTHRRDSTSGRYVVPKVAYKFSCRGCGEEETRVRHPCGGKAQLCQACLNVRKRIREERYNKKRTVNTAQVCEVRRFPLQQRERY